MCNARVQEKKKILVAKCNFQPEMQAHLMFVNIASSVSQTVWRTHPGQLSHRAAAGKGQSLEPEKFSRTGHCFLWVSFARP